MGWLRTLSRWIYNRNEIPIVCSKCGCGIYDFTSSQENIDACRHSVPVNTIPGVPYVVGEPDGNGNGYAIRNMQNCSIWEEIYLRTRGCDLVDILVAMLVLMYIFVDVLRRFLNVMCRIGLLVLRILAKACKDTVRLVRRGIRFVSNRVQGLIRSMIQ
jgi:hypothetical protein